MFLLLSDLRMIVVSILIYCGMFLILVFVISMMVLLGMSRLIRMVVL